MYIYLVISVQFGSVYYCVCVSCHIRSVSSHVPYCTDDGGAEENLRKFGKLQLVGKGSKEESWLDENLYYKLCDEWWLAEDYVIKPNIM